MAKNKALPSVMTASDARTNFYDLAEEAVKNSRRFTISIHGKPSVVIMALDDLEGLEETIDIMSDPELVKDIEAGEADRKAGRVSSLEEVLKELELENENRIHTQSNGQIKKTPSARIKKSYQESPIVGNYCFGG